METVRLAAEARDVPAKTVRLFSTSIVTVKGVLDVTCSQQALSKVQSSRLRFVMDVLTGAATRVMHRRPDINKVSSSSALPGNTIHSMSMASCVMRPWTIRNSSTAMAKRNLVSHDYSATPIRSTCTLCHIL